MRARTNTLAGLGAAAWLVLSLALTPAHAQEPTNNLPNPYQGAVLQLPDGRTWGATAGVDIDKDGKSVWAIDRCGANSCVGSPLDPILKLDASGKLVKSFGKGMFVFPHGIHVDRDGNVWITDMVLADGRGQGAPGMGQQVIKFSPDGKELMRLGKAGVSGNGPDVFSAPSDIVTGANGDIFVSDGHGSGGAGTNERIMKFDRTGKFIKQWGKPGFGKPGTHEFSSLHALTIDSRGRLFIGDRDNNRIQIYDQNGTFLESWAQFSRPSSIYIDPSDNMYVADSESSDAPNAGGPPHGAWKRGIRVGSAKDGSVKYLIPDPAPKGGTSAAEGVAADKDGVIYGAEVGPRQVIKYVRKSVALADTVPGVGGAITVTPLVHSSVQLEHGGKVIQIDPWSAIDLAAVKRADLILVTDGTNGHHFDVKAIAALRKPGVPVIIPASATEKLPDGVVLNNGEKTTAAGITVEAIGAYDITQLDKPGEPSHPKGVANGYLFIFGGKRIYMAGVTECVPEMRAIRNIDLMFVPLNLPLDRMNPTTAADCVKGLKPKVVYPIHYDNAAANRMQNPKSNASVADMTANRATADAFKRQLAGEPIEVRIAFYPPLPAP